MWGWTNKARSEGFDQRRLEWCGYAGAAHRQAARGPGDGCV